MPLYEYKCECGNRFSQLKKVEERDTAPCPECGTWAKHAITPVNFDPKMGLDPAFATFSDKWAKKQRNKGSGKSTDSNNHRYGGQYS
jgi:putative FmdB family regulatory protein